MGKRRGQLSVADITVTMQLITATLESPDWDGDEPTRKSLERMYAWLLAEQAMRQVLADRKQVPDGA